MVGSEHAVRPRTHRRLAVKRGGLADNRGSRLGGPSAAPSVDWQVNERRLSDNAIADSQGGSMKRTIVVTGAASGIGEATAAILERQGDTVKIGRAHV